jgi:Zn-dependent oligopeptidase
LDYREDVYAAVQAFTAAQRRLEGEDLRFYEQVLRDYKRAGLHLPKAEREEVERLRKELSRLSTDFDSHITKATRALAFSSADLEGVPESFLSQEGVKTGDDQYTVMANVTWHYVTVMENARKESTRKRLKIARYSLAKEENVALLQQILKLRHTIANQLGYASWADYRTEPKMARTAATARAFVENLKTGLQPKFEAELEAFRAIKVKETGDPGARIELWDWRYYSNQLKKEQYTVDTEKLRVYFPYEKVLNGMLGVYEQLFGLRIQRAEPSQKWVEDLELYAVSDRNTGEPLGLFYLDMFPREGKFNHFAQFGIIEGKRLPTGKYQRPTVAYFGHLTGYDAGYYGYAWADAIAADMATVFETSKDGYSDVATGMRLRNEIYAPGDSRDVNESIHKFLGRERSLEPFLKTIGIGGN